MEFTLYYRGRLKANGSRIDKHRLRLHFSAQLYELWRHKGGNPRSFYSALPDLAMDSVSKVVGSCRFAALVTRGQFAELEVVMLRPDAPGSIISQGGDIDNRVKTLLDGLRLPAVHELPRKAEPGSKDKVLLCLLEDDRLVTKLSVETQQLLDVDAEPGTVVLLIKVRTRLLRDLEPRIGDIAFG